MTNYRYQIFTRAVFALLVLSITSGCSAEARKSRYLARAQGYQKAGEFEKAKIEYLKVIRTDPNNVEAYKQIGQMWLDQGAPLRAAPFLAKTRQLAPNDAENHTALGRVFITIGQFGEGFKEAMAALSNMPENGEALTILIETARKPEEIQAVEAALAKFPRPESGYAHIARAELAIRKGDMAAAEAEIRKAVEVDPKSATAHVALAAILGQKNAADGLAELKIGADLAPRRSPFRLRYAQTLAQTGKIPEARAYITQMTKEIPDYIPAWSSLADIARSEKKYDEALGYVDTLLSRDPENFEGRRMRGEILFAKGETDKGLAVLEQIDKSYPNVPIIKYDLGRVYLQLKNEPKAIDYLTQATTLAPQFVEASLLLANLNLRSGNAQAVVAALTELTKNQPALLPAQVLLAEALRASGRLDEASTLMRNQVAAHPKAAELYALQGALLGQQGKSEEARSALQKAVELAPQNEALLGQLVDFDLRNKNYDLASALVQQQLAATPPKASAYTMQAKILVAQGKNDLAEGALRKAIEIDPHGSAAYELLVSLYIATNRIPEALGQVEKVLEANPKNPGALTIAGMLYSQQNQPQKSADAYEKLLRDSPNSTIALNNLAYIYGERLNKLDRALELARHARTLLPSDPSIGDTLGWLVFRQGDYQQAMALLQESASKLPENAEVQAHLGMAAYMMGMTDLARSAFQKATTSATDFPGKADAQRRLTLLGDGAKDAKPLSVVDLEALNKDQPNDPIVQQRLGEAYEQQGDHPKAANAYEAALKANPKLVQATASLAQLYAGPLKQKEKAAELAKRARALAPGDPKITATLGKVAYDSGNYPWAYSLFQESARQLASDPIVLNGYAWAAYAVGKIDEARTAMQQIITAAPSAPQAADAKTFLAMTDLDAEGKDSSAGQPAIDEALKTDPNYAPALMAKARASVANGNAAKAIEIYSALLQRFPDFAPSQKRLAALDLEDPSRADQAYDLATKARKTLPDDPELAKMLGRASYVKKEYSRAIQLFQESSRKGPLDPISLFYLGMSHLQTKQTEQAKASLEQSLAGGLKDPQATEAKSAIATLSKK